MRENLKGSLCLISATLIWGSTFVAQSVGMDYIGPFTFQAVRCLIAAIGLMPIIYIRDRFWGDGTTFCSRWKSKKLWIAGFLCSLPLIAANNLQQLGIASTDAGKSAFLTAMYIVIVPLISIFRKKKPTKLVFISVAIAVAGLYFLCGAGLSGFAPGDLLLLGCALMFALQIVFIDMFADSVDALRLNVIQAVFCSLVSSVPMFLLENPDPATIGSCWFPLFYAGFLSMGIAFSLQIIGQKYLEATTASLLMSTESIFAVFFGWLILNEHLSSAELVGCILILISIVLSQIPAKEKANADPEISSAA